MRSIAREESGFTLVELLVASTIAIVVMFAALQLVEIAMTSQVETENRLEAAQRGRQAMEVVGRSLRSQLCPQTGAATIEVAEGDRVKFYSSLVSAENGSVQLQKRVITYEPVAGPERGRLVERVYLNKGTPARPAWNDTAPNDVPDRTRLIADRITPVDAATPVFRYAKYDPAVTAADPARLVALTPPLSEVDRGLIVQVRVAFDAWPTGPRRAERVHTALDSRIHVRTAAPTAVDPNPRCL
jgi:type II secretory pathway pseudopilin PulG